MAALRSILVVAVFCLGEVSAREAGKVTLTVNPIRRVVNMLQGMQTKVEEEGKKEEDLFNKFMCYCKNGKGALESSIEQAKQTNDQLKSSIEETAATLKQMKADLKTAQTDRADAKAAVAKATALREKEAAAFATESGELKTNIAATKKATAAIEAGAGGAFLQTSN